MTELQQAIQMAWVSGNLEYKLKPCQREMRKAILNWHGFKFVIECSRRLGKTYLLCLMSIEACLKKKGALVRYGAPTHKALEKIIIPVMNKVLEDCPDSLRPEFKAGKGMYVFKNSSEMHLAGVNMQPDHLRGTACDFFPVDEAGSVENLDYVVNDIAMPQFLDPDGRIVDGRKLVLASSPAITPAHEFSEIAQEAEAKGNYRHFDIYHGGYSDALIDKFKEECGGEQTTTWKREYLALRVVDSERAIIPEWKEEYEKAIERDEFFKFYLKHESLDIGVRDLTVCLFSYYDFKRAKLIIEDEYVINGPEMTTERLANGIKAKERELYNELTIYKRVSDIDLLLIQDLSMLHNLPFFQTDKGHIEEMVNEVRIWVGSGRVLVNPRCKQLIGCLRYGVWNEKKTEFERSKAYGHFDALASLVYLVRNVDKSTNPVPTRYGHNPEDVVFTRPETRNKVEVFKKAFNLEKGITWQKPQRSRP